MCAIDQHISAKITLYSILQVLGCNCYNITVIWQLEITPCHQLAQADIQISVDLIKITVYFGDGDALLLGNTDIEQDQDMYYTQSLHAYITYRTHMSPVKSICCTIFYWPADVSVCPEHHAAFLGLRQHQKEIQDCAVSHFNFLCFT